MAAEDIFLPEGDFENPLLREQGFGMLAPSTGSVFEAGLGLGKLDAPVNFLQDLNRYNEGEEKSYKLTPEEANKQYGIPNYLNFDRDISPEAAEVIQERTYKRIGLEDRLERASNAQGIASLTGQFIGQMFDPINLGTAFIPVTKIPGASTLLMGLATKNPFVQRAATGAIEGFVGQAAIEPIYAAGDYLDFEDHTASDIMRNLAFGTVFGAGAHVVLGGAYDGAKALYGKTKSTHMNAAQTALNQLLDGKMVDVEPILRADPEYRRNEALRLELENLEATGNYDGPQGYNYLESLPTGTGFEGPGIRNAGDPVITGALAARTTKYDAIEISGDLEPVNLGGSNAGYIAKGADGSQMYVKLQRSGPEPINQNRVKSEMLANNLYQLFGDDLIVPANLVRVNGELGVATPFYEGAKKVSTDELLEKVSDITAPMEERMQVRSMIVNSVIDMFLGNRDAFAFGNIIKVGDQYKKIDQGGALTYRAMGEKKTDFGSKIEELKTMTDPKIAKEAGPFLQETLTRNLLDEGVAKILNTDINKIIDSVLAAKLSKTEEEELIGLLATRYTTLQSMFPDVAKEAGKNLNKLIVTDSKSAYGEILKQARDYEAKLDKLPEHEKVQILTVIKEYQGSGYSQVNKYLRNNEIHNANGGEMDPDFQSQAEIDAMREHIQENIYLLDKASEQGALQTDSLLYRWMPGQVFNSNMDAGYMSTSLFAERSPFHIDENNWNDLLVVVHAPEGTKGFWPDAASLSASKNDLTGSFSVPEAGEYEYVVSRGQKYEIMAVATDKTSVKGNKYKEIHIRLLGEKPAENLRPITLQELTAGATAYHNQPSSAADAEMLVPPEAVSFNSLVEKQTRLDEKYSDPEIEGIIADLEAQARMVLTPEELKATMEPFNQTIKDVDSYVGGLNQAFVCWKNG